MKFLLVLILLPFAAQCYAQAEENPKKRPLGLYVGFGLGSLDVEAKDSFEKDVKFKVGELIGGAYWRWFGAEARMGSALMDETVVLGTNPRTGGDITAKVSFPSYQSYYFRLQFENDIARIYALYGQTEAQTSRSERGTVTEAQTSGDSYGIGAGFMVRHNLYINFESKYLLKTELNSLAMNSVNLEVRF